MNLQSIPFIATRGEHLSWSIWLRNRVTVRGVCVHLSSNSWSVLSEAAVSCANWCQRSVTLTLRFVRSGGVGVYGNKGPIFGLMTCAQVRVVSATRIRHHADTIGKSNGEAAIIRRLIGMTSNQVPYPTFPPFPTQMPFQRSCLPLRTRDVYPDHGSVSISGTVRSTIAPGAREGGRLNAGRGQGGYERRCA